MTDTTQTGPRRIAAAEHNRFVKHGVAGHRPTRAVPRSLLRAAAAIDHRRFRDRHERVLDQLGASVGRPRYADGGFILYEGDCTRLMPAIAAAHVGVHLSITSPPYNIGKEYEPKRTLDDYVAWCAGWMAAVHRLTRDGGAFWLNLGYLPVDGRGLCVPIPYLLWDKSPFYLLQEVVWTYGAGVATKKRLAPRNEKWLYYLKDKDRYTFHLDEIRDPNVKYPNQKKRGRYRCHPLGKNPSDVWDVPKVTTGRKRSSRERTGHPAQFPLTIVERIVRACSNPGEIVFDPFAGSCSAGIAAVALGRLFIGIEQDSAYCQLAIDRHMAFVRLVQERGGRLLAEGPAGADDDRAGGRP